MSILPENVKNPLYLEYYSHVNCKCYKIDIPWSTYLKHTIVLCTESEGVDKATKLAKIELIKFLDAALLKPVEEKSKIFL